MKQAKATAIKDEIVISPKKILRALYDNKLLINSFALLFLLLGLIRLYFSEPMYEAKASILIKNKETEQTKNSIDEAFGINSVGDLKTEIEIIKSKKIINNALKETPFDIKYIVDGLFKQKEIYRGHSPFLVTHYKVLDKNIYDKQFRIKILDDKFYQFEISSSLLSFLGIKDRIYHKGVYQFGNHVKTPYLSFTITKNISKNIFVSNGYFFSINKPDTNNAEDIASRLKIEQASKESFIINISYKDTSPERAKEIVTSLAKGSIDNNVDSKTAQATATLEFIRNQMSLIKANLEKSEKELEGFKKVNNFMDIAVETDITARKLSAFDQQLAQMNIEEQQINRLVETLKKGEYGYIAVETVFPGLTDPLITKLLKSLSDAENKKSALSAEYTNIHPDVIQIDNQIKKLKTDIAANIITLKAGISDRKRSMESIIAKNEGSYRDLPQKEREYINLKREYLVNEKIYSYLLEKESEAAILKASTVSSNSVLDNATASESPISPNANQTLVAFTLIGFAIGITITLVIYFMNGFIEDGHDVLNIVPLSTLYMIPYIKKNVKFNFCNSFRNIRSHILHMHDKDKHQCICISAAFANTGKTTVVSNIASSLAFAQYKTVIVDLDFKESKLALDATFDNTKNIGIRNYFAMDIGIDDLPISYKEDNLYIVTIGSGEYKSTKYLAPKKIFEVVEKLKERFDFVILNCPNTSVTSDAFEYAKYADFTLFVLSAYTTKKRSLEKILSNLTLFDIDLSKVGVVLNRIRWSDYGDGLGCETVEKIKTRPRFFLPLPSIKQKPITV